MNAVTEPLIVGYVQDFYAWTQRQAALMRAGRLSELDRDNLAEEIESMGNEVLHAVRSYLRRAVEHLLYLQFSPASDPREHWADELHRFRREIADRLEDSPSLRRKLDDAFARAWKNARSDALRKLARDGVRDLPDDCPYTLEQLLDLDWLPQASTQVG